MTANLTVAGLLEEAAERLRASIAAREPSATPELDAQLLLAHVLAVPRTRLKSHPEERPHPSRIEEYRRLLARHAAGEPVAYLTGYRHFWSLRLAVTGARVAIVGPRGRDAFAGVDRLAVEVEQVFVPEGVRLDAADPLEELFRGDPPLVWRGTKPTTPS